MAANRTLSESEIIECTGARIAQGGNADRPKDGSGYEVQLDGMWIAVDFASYERVRQIQDSCA